MVVGICCKTCCKFVAHEFKGKGALMLGEGNIEMVKTSAGDPGGAPAISALSKAEN